MAFNLDAYLSARREQIEAALAALMSDGGPAPPSLREAMAYSLLAGGKRLRPILALSSCEAVGGQAAAALPAACAVEMIHTYSLIHDDLPAMDDDDFRRGRPTNHKVHGEAMAILAGDALLTDAFEVLARAPAPPQIVAAAVVELARAAGSAGMVGGQVIDVAATGQRVDLDHLRRMHGMKTGALLTASVRLGALFGGAAPATLEALTRYGEALGLAFQIIDDVLDITADLATLGKDPGSDQAAGKTTFVDLLGVDGARERARAVMGEGLAAIAGLSEAAEPLRALAGYTIERDR
jgi:geranylgeranyl diphosphate synthase type II